MVGYPRERDISHCIGELSRLPTQELLDRLDRLSRRIEATGKKFENLQTVKAIGMGEVGFSEAYLNDRLGVAVFFNIGDRKVALVLAPGLGEKSDLCHFHIEFFILPISNPWL